MINIKFIVLWEALLIPAKQKKKQRKTSSIQQTIEKENKTKSRQNIVYNNSSSKFVCVQPKIMIDNIA